MTIDRPALAYYGGKWQLADWIIGHLPPHECYVEPFAGAASVLLRKPPSPVEVYNDMDQEVVNYFRVLRERPDDLERVVRLTPRSRAESLLSYELAEDPLERARRVFVRSWQTRGHQRDTKNHGWIFWRVSAGAPPDEVVQIHEIAKRFRNVQLDCTPAVDVIKRFDGPDTLFYCDPPYVTETRYRKTGYAHEMTDDDHRALAAVLHSVQGMVVLSGYPSALYDELYADWATVTRNAIVNGGPTMFRKTPEVLWLSPSAAMRARQPSLFGEVAP